VTARGDLGVRALREGVDTRIRPARAVDANGLAGNASERGFDVILHAVPIWLALPSGERRPIVSQNQL
jgi:hypothetical protein